MISVLGTWVCSPGINGSTFSDILTDDPRLMDLFSVPQDPKLIINNGSICVLTHCAASFALLGPTPVIITKMVVCWLIFLVSPDCNADNVVHETAEEKGAGDISFSKAIRITHLILA